MQPLTAAPRDHLDEQQVRDSLAWKRTTSIRWGLDILDTATFADTAIALDVVDGSVTWQWRAQPDEGGAPVQAQVRRRGTLRYRHKAAFNPLSVLYRPWVEMRAPHGIEVNHNWHFEENLDEWAASSGGIGRERVDAVARSGSWSMRITPDGTSSTAEGFTLHTGPVQFPVTVGDTYTADCYSFTPTGYDSTSIQLSFRNNSDSVITTLTSPTIASVAGDWTRHTITGEAPAGATQVRLFVRATGTPAVGDVIHWDDCKVYEGHPSEWVRWHLGVFVATLPPYEYDGRHDIEGAMVWRPLDLADRSHILQSTELDDPIEVPEGTNIALWVRDELGTRFNEFDTTNVTDGGANRTASEDYVFDAGTPWLQVYSTLLGAIGNEPLHANADGLYASKPLEDPEVAPAEHFYSFGTTLLAPITVSAVNPDLPNVVRFVARRAPSLAEEGHGIRTLTNDSTGPGSIQVRGRQVLHRVEVDAQDQEDLDAQARALAPFYFAGGGLRATQQVGLNPRHDDSDVVFLEKPAITLSGNWLVIGWEISLGDIDSMRTMRLELEQLTGAAFIPVEPADRGSFGTMRFGELPYGSSITDTSP